jgi:monoamine oxidase
MARPQPEHIIVIGAGAAGLMAGRELARAGKRVTILEARARCGGRISPLPPSEFGYPAEGGAEYVHGEAPLTHSLLREARLGLLPVHGARWNVSQGTFGRDEMPDPNTGRFYERLAELKSDLTVTDFLAQNFPGPQHDRLRHFVLRMVEGYDAADPSRASMLAVRDEWTNSGRSQQARIVGGYGAMIDFLATDCRRHGAALHLGAVVSAIETRAGEVLIRCADGNTCTADAVVVTVPLPLLGKLAVPAELRARIGAAAEIGFGNVIKLLLRFKTRWWASAKGRDLSDLLFLISDRSIPVWWTQHPTDEPVLTGWFAGPRTAAMAGLEEGALVDAGLAVLGDIFGYAREQLVDELAAARAINWAADPFAGGAYSYATLKTRAAQSLLSGSHDGILFSGEALYQGPEMGTVEAALASGLASARSILASDGIRDS